MFSLTTHEKALVLLCRSTFVENHWFYKQRGFKTKDALKPKTKYTKPASGLHLLGGEKPLVLQAKRPTTIETPLVFL